MATSVTFYGVRGSTPCSGSSVTRYGGNTSCVVVRPEGAPPIILDLGTGLREFGLSHAKDDPFVATALLTHVHWDHVQGIPFFSPVLDEGSKLHIYGPAQRDDSLEATIRAFLSPPYFPVSIDELPGEFTCAETGGETFEVPGATITSALVPHVGPTLGYRIDTDGVSIAYVSDHQQPDGSDPAVDPAVLSLCDGVDLLIHDAQYDDDEFEERCDWGHCTVGYAVEVAARSGAQTLALFHHDPLHDDDRVDELLGRAVARGAAQGVPEVIAAFEGLTVVVDPSEALRNADRSGDTTPAGPPGRGRPQPAVT